MALALLVQAIQAMQAAAGSSPTSVIDDLE